jgi:hypothetical protein
MKSDLFVSEVSFENVAKVMGFIHAFENGGKCNCLFIGCNKTFAGFGWRLGQKKMSAH